MSDGSSNGEFDEGLVGALFGSEAGTDGGPARKRPTVEFFLKRPVMLETPALWDKVKEHCGKLGRNFDTIDEDKKDKMFETFLYRQEEEMKNFEAKLAEFNFNRREKEREDMEKEKIKEKEDARKEQEDHVSGFLMYDNNDLASVGIGEMQIALIALNPAIPADAKESTFIKMARERIEKVHSGFFSVIDDASDPKIMHHAPFAGVVIKYGALLLRDYSTKWKQPEFRSECRAWHESYAAVLMAILKGDTQGNCKNTYHAAVRNTASKAPAVSVSDKDSVIAILNGPIKVHLNAVFKAACEAHTRDPSVARKALATSSLKAQGRPPKSIEKNAQEIKKAIMDDVHHQAPKNGGQ